MPTINGSTNSSEWSFKLEVTESKLDVGANTSTLTIEAYIGRPNSASYMYGASIIVPVTVTGHVTHNAIHYKNAGRVDVAKGAWLKLGTDTFVVTHDADGSKKVDISASFTNNVAPASGSAKGSMTLATIPRASQPSCVTWPEHTQNVGEFGDTISIHMNRKSDKLTHTVRYEYGTGSMLKKGTIATKVTTGTTWTIPLDFMENIPASTSGSGTIYVDTYDGSSFVGTKYCGFTATVPDSVRPSCSVQVLESTDYKTKYGNLVKGLSRLKVKVTFTPAYGSPMASLTVSANGKTYTQLEFTTDVLVDAGQTSVFVNVKDKRGRTNNTHASFPVIDYIPPAVTALSVHRCDEDGTENNQGEYVQVVFSATVTPLNNKNSAAYTLRHGPDDNNLVAVTISAPADNKYSLTNGAYRFKADAELSHIVEIEVKDDIVATIRRTSASTAFALMDWHASGTGICFGGVAEEPNLMDVKMPLRVQGGVVPIEIAENANLNDIKLPGTYRCSLSATAATLTNSPTNLAFVLEVLPIAPTAQRLIEYRATPAPRIFFRNYYGYTDTWGEWAELVPLQNNIASYEDLLIKGEAYIFPCDGYIHLYAHYSAGSYVNCYLVGANYGTMVALTATSGADSNLKGNPTQTVFVRKGMRVMNITTNDSIKNRLVFYPLS